MISALLQGLLIAMVMSLANSAEKRVGYENGKITSVITYSGTKPTTQAQKPSTTQSSKPSEGSSNTKPWSAVVDKPQQSSGSYSGYLQRPGHNRPGHGRPGHHHHDHHRHKHYRHGPTGHFRNNYYGNHPNYFRATEDHDSEDISSGLATSDVDNAHENNNVDNAHETDDVNDGLNLDDYNEEDIEKLLSLLNQLNDE